MRADFRNGVPGRTPISSIDHRMRRCTGLSPSRTSGMALAVMTERPYAKNESLISSATRTSTTRRACGLESTIICCCAGMTYLHSPLTESNGLSGNRILLDWNPAQPTPLPWHLYGSRIQSW